MHYTVCGLLDHLAFKAISMTLAFNSKRGLTVWNCSLTHRMAISSRIILYLDNDR